jgi:biopolymer transport protein ExbD
MEEQPMKARTFMQRSHVTVIGLLLCLPGCGSHSSAAPCAAEFQTSAVRAATVRLNAEDFGSSDDLSRLISQLRERFQQRKQQYFIRFGYEKRTDLPIDQRIEKTVFIKAERSIRLDVFAKVLEAVSEAGAEPVSLPVRDGWEKRDWTGRNLGGRLDPYTLAVLLRQPESTVPLDANGIESLADLEIAGGIPISLSRGNNRESTVLLETSKNGELRLDGNVVARGVLLGALRNWLRANPTRTVVEFRATPDTTFGVLEDAYKATHAAGVKGILLTIGGT